MRIAGRRAELSISGLRTVFVLVVLIRFLTLGEAGSAVWWSRAVIEIPTLALTALASVAVIWTLLRRGLSPWVLDVSVLLDALACGLTLLPAILYPWPSYRGLLSVPDVAIVPVLCVCAGLRLSQRAAIVGSLLNVLSFGGLLAADFVINADRIDYTESNALLYFFYLAAACGLAGISLTRARRLAEQAAFQAERAEASRSGLSRALLDNHDVRSLLSAARINSDLMARALSAPPDDAAGKAVRALRASLDEIASLVEGSRDRAYLELSTSADRTPTEAHAVAERAVRVAAVRFADVAFSASPSTRPLHVWCAGGEQGLERLLLNLLVNAAEGDGHRRAEHVAVELIPYDDVLEIVVADDGPGFTAVLLEDRVERYVSTKKSGSGLGLALVGELARVSGGRLMLENGRRGARVRVELALVHGLRIEASPW